MYEYVTDHDLEPDYIDDEECIDEDDDCAPDGRDSMKAAMREEASHYVEDV